MTFVHKNDFIGIFAQHPVAANLLMLLMILTGVWALTKLNTQFFPTFELNSVSVRVVWSGAAAEDVETAITDPLERELRNLDDLRKITEMLVSLDGTRAEICGTIVRSADPAMVGLRETIAILDGGPGGLDKAILATGLTDCDPDVFDPPAWATDPERFDVDEQGVFEGPVYGFDMQNGDWRIARR